VTDSNPSSALDLPATSGPVEVVETAHTRYVLLGTAHVSRQSEADVEALMEALAFDIVAPELCPSRLKAIEDADTWSQMDLFAIIRQRKGGFLFASLLLTAYQRRIGEQWGVEPGAEMKAAVRLARDSNIEVACIDRELNITLRRTGQALGWWQRFMMFSGMLGSLFSREEITEEDIEKLKQGDVLEAYFSEFAAQSPALYHALIRERDETMAERLRAMDTPHEGENKRQVLAVVGAGHLKGLSETLRGAALEPTYIEQINQPRPASKIWRALPWVIVTLVVTGFALGFSRSPELGLAMVADWVLINGTLSAMGAAIAMAHPLTVVAAFIAAPLTSLNPMVAAGMVTATLEGWLRKPRVSDFHSLRDDVMQWRGWWQNRAARVLLVLVLTNLGSAIATYLAGFRIFTRLT
jgi:pheromone shutdown-related protein TraB